MKEEAYLFSLQNRGIKLGLQRTIKLLEHCNSPHKNIQIIQIIGTNGKGSTSAILAQLLAKDYKIGLYTSPHLFSFQERIRVNGAVIPIKKVRFFLKKYKSTIEKLEASFFEVMTVMAMWYFVESKANYAIMETGLGGKFDSVSACCSNLYGITSISMDHTHILGENLEEITKEKLGGIQSNSTIYSVSQKKPILSVIKKYSKDNNCNTKFIKTDYQLKISLDGDHQKENASLAISIFRYIHPQYKATDLKKNLLSINWFGRNQTLQENPKIIFDVAHNESGILSFIQNIINKNKKYNKMYLLLSLQKHKRIKNIIININSIFDEVIYSQANHEKAMKFSKIKKLLPNAIYIENPKNAILDVLNKSKRNDFIGIIGTHYWGQAIQEIFNISFDNL